MKILIVSQYFWPENFRINDLALALKERGHAVTVLTGKPNYPNGKILQGYPCFSFTRESWRGVNVYRVPLIPRGDASGFRLALNYFSFALSASLKALTIKGNFDKILVYEPSPITVGIPAIMLKWRKGATLFFWVQDLWPQSVSAAGNIRSPFILRLLDALTKWIYSYCDKILIQSKAFRGILESQNVDPEKIIYYPNSVEGLFNVVSPRREVLDKLPVGFKILFAGNIGESQDFDTIIEAARLASIKTDKIKWVIVGNGRKFNAVLEKINELHLNHVVFLLGSFPTELMPEFYAAADCLLVSLKRDPIFSLTIPSKLQSYLACGKPVLTSLDGEGSRVVQEAYAGIVVEAENPVELSNKALEFSMLSKAALDLMGTNARNYFEKNFERELLVTRLEDILNDGDG